MLKNRKCIQEIDTESGTEVLHGPVDQRRFLCVILRHCVTRDIYRVDKSALFFSPLQSGNRLGSLKCVTKLNNFFFLNNKKSRFTLLMLLTWIEWKWPFFKTTKQFNKVCTPNQPRDHLGGFSIKPTKTQPVQTTGKWFTICYHVDKQVFSASSPHLLLSSACASMAELLLEQLLRHRQNMI